MLQPILLTPAFRYGAMTPWGGEMLEKLYGKHIPDPSTGESLEMSVIPGLESRDENGISLRQLIDSDPASMVGTAVSGQFPLLLKIIDARDKLSVQVHPDDLYARLHENKSGKAEAWVILKAAANARIVLGLRSGCSLKELEMAAGDGKKLESLLHYVPAKENDVFLIPPGTVHAIGKGIVLYEIQQSSDVTYRFYDWDRIDHNGNHRPLHIRQVLETVRTEPVEGPVSPVLMPDSSCQKELLSENAYFSLYRLSNCRQTVFSPAVTHFSVLTVLTEAILQTSGKRSHLHAGQTVFIPASCESFRLSCGMCLVSAPGKAAC